MTTNRFDPFALPLFDDDDIVTASAPHFQWSMPLTAPMKPVRSVVIHDEAAQPQQYMPDRPRLLITACLTRDQRKWVPEADLKFLDILANNGTLIVHLTMLLPYQN